MSTVLRFVFWFRRWTKLKMSKSFLHFRRYQSNWFIEFSIIWIRWIFSFHCWTFRNDWIRRSKLIYRISSVIVHFCFFIDIFSIFSFRNSMDFAYISIKMEPKEQKFFWKTWKWTKFDPFRFQFFIFICSTWSIVVDHSFLFTFE